MNPLSLGPVLCVAAGGAIGSVARHVVGVMALRHLGADFPWGTLAVNVLGSAAIGVIGGAIAAGAAVAPELRLFLVTGILGGFTTFSSFSLDTGALFERSPWLAALYLVASILGGLAAFVLGWWLAPRG
ncbi:fluoride efflux transporter CrcB [Roseomonas xinghualingensis]|uniref:fluoride efflux transporter CrcB n=1 Tax=Roseomonas xinghualingensis TaxID=2986475 RepID=UPI0021F23928|nr:fluoride efflux transporter CrcB [Roseomonas sp. SXEYE001]MCV4207691.1 fluoride efflux transporter CrcB [Roseomonas sp. SXEYE001]